MKLKQALNIVNENKIHMVIEVTDGYFEYKTLDYLSDEAALSSALNFASKWRERKVSYIHFNKARNAIEIDCYMKKEG